jgi:hypothetical protein
MIVVYARASIPMAIPLRFDVATDAMIFDPHNFNDYTMNGSKRVMHFNQQSVLLDDSLREIFRVRGRVLQSSPPYSDITIENYSIDSSFCPTIFTDKGVISITSCFSSARNVSLVSLLTATMTPNPVGENSTLHIVTNEKGIIHIAIADMLGREVQTENIEHPVNETDHVISFKDLSAGSYVMTLKSALQSIAFRFVKRD